MSNTRNHLTHAAPLPGLGGAWRWWRWPMAGPEPGCGARGGTTT